MSTIVRARRIDSPPSLVWEVLADYGRIAVWASAVGHSEQTTPGEPGIGATRRVQVRRLVLLETVTAWEPEQELVYTIEGLPRPVPALTNRWGLVAVGSGTSATLTVATRSRGRTGAGLVAAALTRGFARANARLLADLDAWVVGRAEGS
ncbi:MAG: SRPBCC family protein [Acidimicrobiales bacterium]